MKWLIIDVQHVIYDSEQPVSYRVSEYVLNDEAVPSNVIKTIRLPILMLPNHAQMIPLITPLRPLKGPLDNL